MFAGEVAGGDTHPHTNSRRCGRSTGEGKRKEGREVWGGRRESHREIGEKCNVKTSNRWRSEKGVKSVNE